MTNGLKRTGATATLPIAARLGALAAVPAGLANIEASQFEQILSGLAVEQPIPVRSASADILEKAFLSEAQLLQLCEIVKTVSPLELDRVLGAFAQSTSAPAGMKLLA